MDEEDETFLRGLKPSDGQTRPPAFASREEAEAEGKRRAEVRRQIKAQQRMLEQTAQVQQEMKAQQERVAQLAQDNVSARNASDAVEFSQHYRQMMSETVHRERELQEQLLCARTEQTRMEFALKESERRAAELHALQASSARKAAELEAEQRAGDLEPQRIQAQQRVLFDEALEARLAEEAGRF